MADPNTDFNPAFGAAISKLQAAAAAKGIKTHFISGVRSLDDQKQLYANYQAGLSHQPLPYPERGAVPLAAKPGTSLHERGFAADLVADDASQQAQLRALGNQVGLRTLGARDPNHFELPSTQIAKAPSYTPGSSGTATAFAPTAPVAPAVAAINSATGGTRINSPVAPVAGALAKPEVGPENAGGGATAASEGPLDVRQLVYNKLTGAGLQSHQALGAIWSLAGESGAGLNPNAYNPKDPGGAVGIGQWNQSRRTALEAFAKARGTAVTDPNTQADYLVDELTNTKSPTYQPGVFKAMQGAGTAADATKIWTTQFERPKVDNSDKRIQNGVRVASLDNNGGFVLGAGAPANTGSSPATTVATAPTTPTTPAAPQSLWDKLTGTPVDAEGKPVAGAKSPLQELTQASIARLGSEGQTERQEAPAQSALSMQGPGVHMPIAPSQAYGMTLNSFSTPLTWGRGARVLPGLGQAGLQGAPVAAPGVSLNSVLPSSQGLGYGIDDVGYGYG